MSLASSFDTNKCCHVGLDALCGNTLLIAIDELMEEGLLDTADKPKKQPIQSAVFEEVSLPFIQRLLAAVVCQDWWGQAHGAAF